jgi:hypothetical protein
LVFPYAERKLDFIVYEETQVVLSGLLKVMKKMLENVLTCRVIPARLSLITLEKINFDDNTIHSLR